jgi:hypothetical protein
MSQRNSILLMFSEVVSGSTFNKRDTSLFFVVEASIYERLRTGVEAQGGSLSLGAGTLDNMIAVCNV